MHIGNQLAILFEDPRPHAPLTWAALARAYPIAVIDVDDTTVVIRFDDGTELRLSDDGQSCCERRYMSTDDNLGSFIGAYLTGIEVADGGRAEGEYGDCHEQMFLKIDTSNGGLTIVSHNEHNGYYGGISITPKWVQAEALIQ